MKMSGRTRALEFDPEAVTPISAAFMLAPTILRMLSFGPFPIVRMHLQLEFRAILVPRLHVPAIAVVVTHNFSRGASCAERQRANRNHNRFCRFSHRFFSAKPSFNVRTALAKKWFRNRGRGFLTASYAAVTQSLTRTALRPPPRFS